MSDPLERLRLRADARRAAGLRRAVQARPADGGGLIDLASNDYLGLARHPRVVAGAEAAARRWGGGSTGSRLVTGTTALHVELEQALAAHVGAGAGLVFSSGYLANLGAVAALGGPDVLVVSDALNHASIVDACRLSRSRVVVAPHRDTAAVEAALAGRAEPYALVVTDAVFSVDGDLAPLAELYRIAQAHGALLVIDEAHSLGVVGDRGQGAAHAAGLAGRPDIVLTATLSKSLASQGGAVLADPEVVAHLVDAARPFIFDTGLAPAATGAAYAALQVLAAEPDRPMRARAHAAALSDAARSLGLRSPEPAAAVAAVLMGAPEAAVAATERCAELGVRVGCFRPPSVPDGVSRLRLTGRADLTTDDLGRAIGALAAVRDLQAHP